SHSRPRSNTPVWLETVIPSSLTVTSSFATAAVVAEGVLPGSPIPPAAASVDDGVATATTTSTAAIFRLRNRPISSGYLERLRGELTGSRLLSATASRTGPIRPCGTRPQVGPPPAVRGRA